MLQTIDWLVITAYVLLSLAIGLYFRNRASQSLNEYFLGGRKFPWYLAGISMVATTFAADTPLAVTELVGQNGISGNWLWWNMLIGGMLTTFFFARLWRRANVLTELEFIAIRYSGAKARFLRGFKSIYLGLFMNAIVIAWVNVALMSLFKVFFNLDTQSIWLFTAAAMLIAASYSVLSGLWGVAITDVVQFTIAMLGSIVLAVFVINSDAIGGLQGLTEKLPEASLSFFPQVGENQSVAGVLSISVGAFLAYGLFQWWSSWYPGAEPGGGGYIAQRMMSAKDEKNSIYATLFFQVAHYAIRPWPWILVALAATIIYPDLGMDEKRLGYVLAMKDFLPAGFKGLLLVAFLAAYMSTISTQLNFGASFLTNDFYLLFSKKKKTAKQQVKIAQLMTLLIMVVALLVTSMLETISGAWVFIIECGAGLGLVLILRWYWWRINAWSEISATVAPFVAYAFSHFILEWKFPNSFFLTVGFTTLVWLLVTYLTAPTETATLREFYRRVQPSGFWQPFDNQKDSDKKTSNIPYLLVSWLTAVLMTYSILFFTGKLLFHDSEGMLIWGVVGLISFIGLRWSVKKTGVLD